MAQYTTMDSLDGIFKTVYGEKGPIELIPAMAMLYREVALRDTEKQGLKFSIPVIVAHSQGFTYNTTSGSAFSLNNSIAMTTQEAEISSSEIVLTNILPLRVASRSVGGNKKAFKEATELVVMDMKESHVKRNEIAYLYGGSSAGVAEADSSVNASATTTTVTFTSGSWADGIVSGLENSEVNFYSAAGSIVSSGADAVFTISRVNPNSKTMLITGTATGITALDSALGSANQFMFFKGAYGEECVGILKQLSNTGSLFGIDAAVYGLWRGNVYDVGSAQLTMRKVLKAAAIAYGRGLEGKCRVLLNPLTFADLASDMASYRRYDGSYSQSKATNGSQMISFFGQNGEIEIVGHTGVKPQDAFLIDFKHIRRLGSSDVVFGIPGVNSSVITQFVPGINGFEIRSYSDTCIFIDAPARCVYFQNIVNLNS